MRNAKSHLLIRAVRAGDLAATIAAIEAGADPDTPDEWDEPGLPLRIASFNGRQDIIRELIARGATIDPQLQRVAEVPIALAVRGGQQETVRLLLELGARIPPGLPTGLSLPETLAAQGVAHRRGTDQEGTPLPADWNLLAGDHVEVIDLDRCLGIDTAILDAELMGQAAAPAAMPSAEDVAPLTAIDFDRFKFWKKKS